MEEPAAGRRGGRVCPVLTLSSSEHSYDPSERLKSSPTLSRSNVVKPVTRRCRDLYLLDAKMIPARKVLLVKEMLVVCSHQGHMLDSLHRHSRTPHNAHRTLRLLHSHPDILLLILIRRCSSVRSSRVTGFIRRGITSRRTSFPHGRSEPPEVVTSMSPPELHEAGSA
jgi:hypothetical protein